MKRLFIIVVLLLGLATPAGAYEKGTLGYMIEMHAKEVQYESWLEERLFSMQDGIGWANAVNETKGYPLLYCQPRQMVLKGEQIFDIMKRYAETRKDVMTASSAALGLYIIRSLSEVFPCPK